MVMSMEEMNKMYAERERLWHEIANLCRREGIKLSRPLFMLTIEDLVWVLAEKAQQGSFDINDANLFMPDLIAMVEEEMDYELEWHPVMEHFINEYKSDLLAKKG